MKHKMKLVCFDMDGVIFEKKNFWFELHKEFGTYEKGVRLTNKYLKSDYAKLVEEVVAKLWKGKKADRYFWLVKNAKYIPRVKQTIGTLKKRKLKTAIITSGPKHLALRAKKETGIDFVFANELIIRRNAITGKFKWPLGHGTKEKSRIVKELCHRLKISLKDVAYVGDNDNDIGVCKKVGLSIAFNSSSKKLEQACKVVVRKKDLREILSFLK